MGHRTLSSNGFGTTTSTATARHSDAATICAHAGIGSGDGQPLVTPLCASTTFCRDGVGSQAEHQYSRVSNPTVAALEDALAQLEDAAGSVCFGSGLAAETALFLATLRSGDHAVCARSVYGGTTRLIREIFGHLGVESTFVDATDAKAIEEAVIPGRTKLVFVETPANPTLELTDIRAAARAARQSGALLAVDNTFLTSVLQKPLDLGADVSVYSTTKFIEGHSVATGGALVSRDPALLEKLRFTRKCTGGIQAPFNAWETLRGLKTLALRVQRQSATAERVAAWLAERSEIGVVYHPSRPRDVAQRAIADRQHLGAKGSRHGAVVTIELGGEYALATAAAFCRALKLCRLVEHVGSTETLVTHPATMTHADVPPEQRAAAGVSDGLVRISVGLEEPDEIIADLARGIDAARAAATGRSGETGRSGDASSRQRRSPAEVCA
ncbi:MAG: cystathionine gamma-synthase [Phycisphaerae bacterium]|nr:cystathionine gamma-synthase [Phycisphaerae bacterium]